MHVNNAYVQAGLATDSEARSGVRRCRHSRKTRQRSREEIQREEQRVIRRGSSNFRTLGECVTPDAFKAEAKQVLLSGLSEERLKRVIDLAQRFKDNPGFVCFFYDLRDALRRTAPGKHGQLLNRAFRRRNPTFQVSQD